MALNFSQRPVFKNKIALNVSPLRIVNRGYAVERISEKGGENDSVTKDIIDLLPSDPFGMDIDISSTFTTITGWFGDLELDYNDYMKNKIVNHKEDYGLFAGFNFFWNSATRIHSFPSNLMYNNCGSASVLVTKSVNDFATCPACPDVIGGEPHEAFLLALSYLGIKDLLVVECVSRSLCSTVRNDSLLWRNLYIDQPLNEKITDDILVQLTNRAEGYLLCLSLITCPKITDDGLRRVLETNPKLTKLFIPGCTRLSIEGMLNNLKAFKSSTETSGIKHIRTGGFYGITLDHYEHLKNLLGIVKSDYSPHYYHRANFCYLPSDDDDRAIDVEVCPRCWNPRLVYDCPAASCQPKDGCPDICRACIICIPRCAECGRCVHNSEYEETFSLEYLCSECLKQLPRCQQRDPVDSICLHG